MTEYIDLRQYLTQKALMRWAAFTKQNTDRQIYRSCFLPALKTSQVVDSVGGWLLAGTGATAALLASNLSSLAPLFAPGFIRLIMVTLGLSFAVGIVAKYCAIYVQIACNTDEATTELLKAVLEKHNEEADKMREVAQKAEVSLDEMNLDFGTPLYDLIMATPFYLRRFVRRAAIKTIEDWRYPYIKATKIYHIQSLAVFVQSTLFVISIILAAVGLRIA
jgi:hypothetical protein